MTSSPPTGRRRTRLSADERRASILAAATEVFAEHGYRSGKVSEVAARVGVTEPVVFQNFKSKAALFAAVVERAAEWLSDQLADAASSDTPVPVLLAELMSPAHLDRLHDRGELGVLFADAVSAGVEPQVSEAGQAAVRRIAGALSDLVRQGREAGQLRPDVDPDAVAWLLISLISARRFRQAALPDTDRGAVESELAAMAMRTITPTEG
ncbi:TetR/AcrR family transcriptional regulator [Kitasatospora phosalacinea]|uniref:TetR/AcrR family transcriptional regulator n=1 Tax=Kitasatospora phosalacinea TaxID=2065 RepID=UPI00364C177E